MRKSSLLPLALVAILLLLLPLQAVLELPGEREVKTAFGVDYPRSCDDYDLVGKGEPGDWREEPPLSDIREDPRVAVVGGNAYLAGGLIKTGDEARSVGIFEVFDFDTGRYRSLPDLPELINHVGIAAYRRDVYVAGGFEGGVENSVSTDRMWRYRVADRRWEPLSPLPSSRGGHSMVVVGDKMYSIGGRFERLGPVGRSLADVDVYDFERDEWSPAAPMSQPRDHLGATVLDGKIYAVGGRMGGGEAYRIFERYDPARDEWERLPDYRVPISGTGLVTIGDRVVAAGGEDPGRGRLIGEAWAYDPSDRRWERLPFMSRPKHGFGVAAANGRYWAFGGAECFGFNPTDSVDSLRVE